MAAKSTKTAATAQGAAQKVRIVLGALVVLNLVAAGLVMYPPGGSAEGLEQEMGRLQDQLMQAKARVETTRAHVASVETGRDEGDQFLKNYFADRRTVNSSLVDELGAAADRAGLKLRSNAYAAQLIEGSDTLGMMTITANYEGTYANLVRFTREIDRSPSLLIIESMTAAPQQGSDSALIALKLDTFTQESGEPFPGGPVAAVASGEEAAQ